MSLDLLELGDGGLRKMGSYSTGGGNPQVLRVLVERDDEAVSVLVQPRRDPTGVEATAELGVVRKRRVFIGVSDGQFLTKRSVAEGDARHQREFSGIGKR